MPVLPGDCRALIPDTNMNNRSSKSRMMTKGLVPLIMGVSLAVVILVLRFGCRRTTPTTPVQNSNAVPVMALPLNRSAGVITNNPSTNVTATTVPLEVVDRPSTNETFPRWADEAFSRRPVKSLNRFSFNARFGLNISAKFRNMSGISLTAPPSLTPDGSRYNYDDGYVLTDISGNAGGETWNWGYDQSGQVSGNTISMHRSTVSADAPSATGVGEGDPQSGFEFTYDRELGSRGKLDYGLEAAVNYMNLSMKDTSTFSGDVSRLTDTYPFTPGTTPPPAPYQGSFNGPGFVLGSTPVSSTTTLIPGGATIMDQRNYSADIWGFRLGPYAEYPFSQNLDLWFSGGLAVALANSSASWTETASIAGGGTISGSGGGHDLGLLWGAYLSAELSWQLSEHWSIDGGAQYQYLGNYEHNFGGQAIQLDLSRSMFITAGLSYSF
jgi:YD repeat-containing protein